MKKKACDQESSDRWSTILHNYLRKNWNRQRFQVRRHFQFLDDAKIVFSAVASEPREDISREQEKIVIAFSDFLVGMCTDNQVAQILSIYSENFEMNDDIKRFVGQYVLQARSLNEDQCHILKNILSRLKKPEALAQFLYFIIASDNEASIKFGSYLLNTKLVEKSPCYFQLFSDLLLRIKKSDQLEVVLSRIATEDYARRIREKITMLEAEKKRERIKEYLNPLYSFMTKNKGKLGFFTAAFIAFYFGYLKNVLKRVKTPQAVKSETVP